MNNGAVKHHALDATKMVAAAFLGWTITESHIDTFFKFAIAGATLLYMTGKAALTWLHFYKEKHGEKTTQEVD